MPGRGTPGAFSTQEVSFVTSRRSQFERRETEADEDEEKQKVHD